jgi:hypothetical protein
MTRPVFAALVALAACGAPAQPPARPIPAGWQPGTCDAACARLARLGCPEADDTRTGIGCPALCVRVMAIRPLNLGCVEHATSRAEVRTCDGFRCLDDEPTP